MTQRYQYCFTYNNYVDDLLEQLKNWLMNNCKYACLQKEIAPDTGTPHVQGYLNLVKKLRTQTLQNSFQHMGIHLHLEYAKGNARQNRDYCSKPGGTDFWEHGSVGEQGKRSDLSDVAAKVLGKRSIAEVAVEHPETYIRYHRGIKALAFEVNGPPDSRQVEVTLYFGDAGTGKSWKAESLSKLYDTDYHSVKQPDSSRPLYWDTYKGQKVIIIDEFKGWISPTRLNGFLDHYKLELDCRNATQWARWEHVFIISNYEPEQWWSENVIWNRQSLFRRLTHIYEFRGTSHVDVVIKKIK